MTFLRTITCLAAAVFTLAQAEASSMNDRLTSYVNAAGASRQTTTNLEDSFIGSTYYRDDVSLGSLQVRVPTETVGVSGSFTPPTVDAGCGGIDAHWGSLSFELDADVTGLLEAIPQQALGYAFRLALNSLSPMMDGIIGDIDKSIKAMNQFQKNSCDLAKAAVDKGAVYLENNYRQNANNTDADSRIHNNDITDTSPLAEADQDRFDTQYLGNLVYVTLVSNQVYQQAGATSANDPFIDLLMSLSGTVITTLDDNVETTSGESKRKFRTKPIGPALSLTLKELIESDGLTDVPILRCNTRASSSTDDLPKKCLAPTIGNIRFTGMQRRIVDGYIGNGGSMPGIFKRIRMGTKLSDWSNEERTIFLLTDIEIRNKMVDMAVFSDGAARAIILENAAIIAREYTYAIITNMFDTVESAINGADSTIGGGEGISQLRGIITVQRNKLSNEYTDMIRVHGGYLQVLEKMAITIAQLEKATYVLGGN